MVAQQRQAVDGLGIGQIVEIGLGGDIVPGGNQSKGVNGEETGQAKGKNTLFIRISLRHNHSREDSPVLSHFCHL
ncbi:hypothetical protein ACHWUR_22615 [Klebsiella pneumoniae]